MKSLSTCSASLFIIYPDYFTITTSGSLFRYCNTTDKRIEIFISLKGTGYNYNLSLKSTTKELKALKVITNMNKLKAESELSYLRQPIALDIRISYKNLNKKNWFLKEKTDYKKIGFSKFSGEKIFKSNNLSVSQKTVS